MQRQAYIVFLASFFLFLAAKPSLQAQRNYDLHWLSFTDKNQSPYSLFAPQAYLSARALERRQRYNCAIDSSDLPVNPKYLEAIRAAGFSVLHKSRWLNGAAVICSEEEAEALVKKHSFISKTRSIGFSRESKKSIKMRQKITRNEKRLKDDYYGLSKVQIEMLNGHYIQSMGYRGTDVWIAVMDGGFSDAPETPGLDSLFAQGRLLATRDFVEDDSYVFESSDHGRDVLSCMAANMPYLMIGTAPDASYLLCKTEDEQGEYVAEEYHWIAALEYADSLGIDIVNTSLGYYAFDDRKMDYGYSDLKGEFAPASIAAGIAARKGLLLVTSAGNEGGGKWKHITVPGDAPTTLTVGAVDRDGKPARFSSEGFEDYAWMKPNLVARGHAAIVAAPFKMDTRIQFGTSFSSPILAGMIGSLRQALPDVEPQTLIRRLEHSASQFQNPDTKMGYGIPDFLQVFQDYSGAAFLLKRAEPATAVYWPTLIAAGFAPHVFIDEVNLNIETELYSAYGQLIEQERFELTINERSNWHYSPKNWDALAPGSYILYIRLGDITRHIYIPKY